MPPLLEYFTVKYVSKITLSVPTSISNLIPLASIKGYSLSIVSILILSTVLIFLALSLTHTL